MKRLHVPNQRELRRQLVRRGWKIVKGGRHPHMAVWTNGRKIPLHCSPSDPHAINHLMRDIRRIEEGLR